MIVVERFFRLRNTVRYFVVYVAGIAILALASQSHSATLFLIASAVLVVGAVLFHQFIRRANEPGDLWFDIVFGVLASAAGLALIRWWAGDAPDVAGFGGVALAGFGYRTLLRRARAAAAKFHHGAQVFMVAGVILTIIAVVGIVLAYPAAGEDPPWLKWIVYSLVMITGLALFAEGIVTFLRPKGRFHSIVVPGLAGLAILGGSMVAMDVLGLGRPWLFLLTFLVLLGVGSIVSETDYDVAGMVIVAAMFWALTPGAVDRLPVIAGDTRPALVALGDSYISGEGANAFYEGTNTRSLVGDDGVDRRNECRRAPTAYPVLLAGDDHRLVSVACSAARILHVTTDAQYVGEPIGRTQREGLPQLEHLQLLVDPLVDTIPAVLVSVGGNDAGFGEIGSTCIFPGDCTAVAQVWLDGLAGLQGNLETVYQKIKDQYPNVPVAVVPYPTPIAEIGCESSALNASEHWFIAEYATELQDVIAAAASSAGVHYLAVVRDALTNAGMRVCDDEADGVNFIDLSPVDGRWNQGLNPTNWIHNSLHPNARGHEELARVIARDLSNLGANPAPVSITHDVRTLEELMAGNPIATCEINGCQPGDPDVWGREQIKRALIRGAVPAFMLATGAWLVWIAVIRWRRDLFGRGATEANPRSLMDRI